MYLLHARSFGSVGKAASKLFNEIRWSLRWFSLVYATYNNGVYHVHYIAKSMSKRQSSLKHYLFLVTSCPPPPFNVLARPFIFSGERGQWTFYNHKSLAIFTTVAINVVTDQFLYNTFKKIKNIDENIFNE